jgi:hypothetical protein
MRRREAVALFAFGLLCVVAGLAWQFGGWGLLGGGVGVLLGGLFLVDIKPEREEGSA